MSIGVTTRETEPEQTHVRVLDSSLVFAEALARALGRVGLHAVSMTLDRLPDVVAALPETEPHPAEPTPVLLIDADDIAGVYWHATGLRTCRAPVVLLAASVTPRLRVVARRLGAKAILTRETGLDELAAALVAVAAGGSDDLDAPVQVDGKRHATATLTAAGPPITERQRQILSLMALGEHNDDIAARLGLSRHTVRTHVQNLLARLGVNSRLSAVVAARDLDLIDPVPGASGIARRRP